ncbi:MAG: stage IV sporulation protein A [Lachnospira sp.]
MDNSYNIYRDISTRTNGEIYFGVVGPVRTGKSTFIKRFMDLYVIPNMENEFAKERARDELPQSAGGTTVMTTEPKFVPSESAVVCPIDDVSMKVRLIDCVGFMVDGANGHTENGKERMVKTPWSDVPVPFTKAAETGTRKVIKEHSTIGIVVTTDGSFSDIDRDSYIPAEETTIAELKNISKPFIVVLNCLKPYSEESREEARKMSEKYGVEVIPMNCDQLRKEDVTAILNGVLKEFPVTEINFYAPDWIQMLDSGHWLKKELFGAAYDCMQAINTIKDTDTFSFDNSKGHISAIELKKTDPATGVVNVGITIDSQVYYNIISELTGTEISDDYELISTIRDLALKKQEYVNVGDAMSQVRQMGYGVVTPVRSDIELDEPVVIHNGNKYGVKIKAKVPSINLLKTQIQVEIAPIVGTKNQAEDLIEYIKNNTKEDPDGIWETNIFGKTIEQIVNDGIYEKTHNITQESMDKISDTLEKVMNENSGLVCLIV